MPSFSPDSRNLRQRICTSEWRHIATSALDRKRNTSGGTAHALQVSTLLYVRKINFHVRKMRTHVCKMRTRVCMMRIHVEKLDGLRLAAFTSYSKIGVLLRTYWWTLVSRGISGKTLLSSYTRRFTRDTRALKTTVARSSDGQFYHPHLLGKRDIKTYTR